MLFNKWLFNVIEIIITETWARFILNILSKNKFIPEIINGTVILYQVTAVCGTLKCPGKIYLHMPNMFADSKMVPKMEKKIYANVTRLADRVIYWHQFSLCVCVKVLFNSQCQNLTEPTT